MIPTLQAEGYEVFAAQYGLDTLWATSTPRCGDGAGRRPAILVGHSYGGTVITARAPTRVVGLVYICALGPDETETSGQQDKFPTTDVFQNSKSRTAASG